jgi:hypothetical protein
MREKRSKSRYSVSVIALGETQPFGAITFSMSKRKNYAEKK